MRFDEPSDIAPSDATHPGRGQKAPRIGGGPWVLLVIVFGLALVFAVANSEGRESEGGQSEDRGQVVEVPNEAVVAPPTEAQEQLVLSGPWEIEPDDFVTTKPGPKAEEGFLLKALAVEEAGGDTIVETEGASLFEAVPSGSLVAGPSAFQELEPAGDLAEYVYAALDLDELFHHLPCKGSGKSPELKGGAERGYEPFFDMSWQRKGRPSRWIESAEAGLRGNVTAHVTAKSEAKLTCGFEPPAVSIPIFGAVVFAGPVPVPITVHAGASLGATATIEGKTHTSATAGIDGVAGLEYRRGHDGLEGKVIVSPTFTVSRPKVEASAKATVTVKPGIGMTVGWSAPYLGKVAATAKVNLVTGVEASWEKDRRPPAEACMRVSLEGKIIFHLLKKKFGPDLPKPELAKKCVTGGPTADGSEAE